MSNRTRFRGIRRCGVVLAVALASLAASVDAQAAGILGTAEQYAVLAGSTVTNTGSSVLMGNAGVFPGIAVVGFPPGVVVPPGTIHAGDANAQQAQVDLTTAYNTLQGVPSQVNLTGQNLGGLTLPPAVYSFATSAQMTGVTTLNGLGNPDAQFVFQIGTTLTTASNSALLLINGARACNVYWAVGSSATLGTNSIFAGSIVASTSITLNTGASLTGGRALAQNGAVTLDNNVITEGCPASDPTTPDPDPTPTPPTAVPIASQPPPASHTTRLPRRGTSTLRRTTPAGKCTDGFTASVRGSYVKSVVFRLDGKRIASRRSSPFQVYVKAAGAGPHKLTARVSYKDATRATARTLRYRGCAEAALRPRRGPSQFTG